MNGEIFLSLIREFSVVNCKSMADPSWLCCYGHASLSFLLLSLSEMHLSKHCRLRWLHSISAIFNQMPYFGVCRISSLSSHRFALAGWKAWERGGPQYSKLGWAINGKRVEYIYYERFNRLSNPFPCHRPCFWFARYSNSFSNLNVRGLWSIILPWAIPSIKKTWPCLYWGQSLKSWSEQDFLGEQADYFFVGSAKKEPWQLTLKVHDQKPYIVDLLHHLKNKGDTPLITKSF